MDGAPNVLSRTTLLREQAYSQIKTAILTEEFKPGQLLSEKLLTEHLGMSKTPIKSALDRLETEGFVYVSPKQGILVKELSITKINDIFQLRIVIETFVCQLLAGKLSQAQQERLRENLARQQEAMETNNKERFTVADSDFHLLLCEFSGNAEVYQVMNNYQAYLYRFALNVLRRIDKRMDTSLQDHHEIFNKLLQGEGGEAARLMKEHLQYGQNVLSG